MGEESNEQWEERLLREMSSVGPEMNELIERRVKMLSAPGVETWRYVERQLAYYFEGGVFSEQKAIDATEACLASQFATYRKREDQANLKAAMSLQARAFWRTR